MSPNILEIFASDSRKYLDRLQDALNAEGGADIDGLRRASRRLHHAAVLANHAPVIDAAQAVQKATVQVIAGKRDLTDDLLISLQLTVDAMDAVVKSLPDGDGQAEDSLRQAAGTLMSGPADVAMAPEVEVETGGDSASDTLELDEAGAVLGALIDDLGDAIERLGNDPRDREPLKVMLRKIRRLRDLGRIEVLSAEDKALSAVEELILQIADLNATVGPGYLTVFRHAKEVLEGMQADDSGAPSVDQVSGRAVEVDRLKESVMEKARRARLVVWVSDLFFPEGPHIVECPTAIDQAGSAENYFMKEASQRLERCESLQEKMLESNPEQMRLAGESLAHTLRHLRERAAAFNHMTMGRVTRRAAAALRAQLVKPPSQVRGIAAGLGDVLASLRVYLENDDEAVRAQAVRDAEAALSVAILGGEPQSEPEEPEFDPDAALQQALALRTRVDGRLKRLSGPDAEGLRSDLEELFDLIALYVAASAEHH
jgi:hypothetical protein